MSDEETWSEACRHSTNLYGSSRAKSCFIWLKIDSAHQDFFLHGQRYVEYVHDMNSQRGENSIYTQYSHA